MTDDINMYYEVLNKFPMLLAIWRKKEDYYECVFANRPNLSLGDKFSDHIKDKRNKNKYLEIFSREEVIIKEKESNVYLVKILPECFYELLENPGIDNYHLLSIVSHKIRGPLTNIIGMLTLLEDMNMNSAQTKYLNIIKKSSLEVVTLANDIVDLINITQDRVKLKMTPVNIRNCVKQLISIIKPIADKKKIQLSHKIDPRIPEICIMDCDRIKQILITLLTNAIIYTNQGSVVFNVELYDQQCSSDPNPHKKVDPPRYNILFKIQDTGIGIDEQKAEVMRDMLLIKKTNKYISYKTCGFSLMIGHHLADMMGGNIWFDSKKDIGTVFYLNIICDTLDLDD